jgi:Zn-dependent peptidase ImmA (M78 family)
VTRVAVSAPVLNWALGRSSNPRAIERKFPKLPNWVQGESRPTLRQLEQFAKATSTPLGYLFLPEPPREQLSIPYFRTLDVTPPGHPSSDLLETVQTMERRQAWLREYLSEQGRDPLPFIRKGHTTDDPPQLASEMKRTLGLAERWAAEYPTWTAALRELQRRMEDAGIVVVVSGIVGNNTRRKLNPDEFRGFVLVDDFAPLVFVNGADGKAAQMFTLAHELVHTWIGSSAAFDLRRLQPANDATERTCNIIAAEFLVPAREFRQVWPSAREEQDPFEAIARDFKVSTLVAARRALDLGFIAQAGYLSFYQRYERAQRRAARSQGGGNFYATQTLRIGRHFAAMVIRATREGTLLYREAYRLTGLYGKSFEEYAKYLSSKGSE